MDNTLFEMSKLHFQGNIIDNGWIENLKYENGKTNMNAVMILSEIVYWYRPTEIRDETTGNFIGWKNKFKADKLQKSYQALGDRFGITKRQVKLACDYLKDKQLIETEFRTINVNGTILNNVMYINLNIENLKKITGIDRTYQETAKLQANAIPITTECNRANNKMQEVLQQNVPPISLKCKTNTETTTNITTEITQISSPEEEKIYLKFKNSTKNNAITVSQKEKLKEFINTYSAELVLKAIDETVMRASIFNLSYLETLLKDWKTKDMQTVKEIDNTLKNSAYGSKKGIQAKESTFNNFEQRTYDFEDLEKKLLGWQD